ncbi:hypothetical protein EJ08DRAFT_645464, partial [Tothia fuscella]
MNPSLQIIPNELKQHITTCLRANDLSALRLTSKELCANAEREFDTYFNCQTYLDTEEPEPMRDLHNGRLKTAFAALDNLNTIEVKRLYPTCCKKIAFLGGSAFSSSMSQEMWTSYFGCNSANIKPLVV